MKLAIIAQDQHTLLLKKGDSADFNNQLSNIESNICLFEEKPNKDVLSYLESNDFKIIYLSELIRQNIVYNNPSFSDIIKRKEAPVDNTDLIDFYQDKVILITGGEGFIGSEIVSTLLKLPIKKVVVFGHGENAISTLNTRYETEERLVCVLGDIRDIEKINATMKYYSPDIVFHAAAHKHVPILDLYPEEAVKTNILGTINTINASKDAYVKHFVFVSTDKAVNPISALGASKRIAEKICLAMDEFISEMRITTVRFGNVFGSVGSVVPIFLEQIANNNPLTITDPDMLRYFMSMDEAARLVLLAATTDEGNLFTFDMGDPISIGELARLLFDYIGLAFDINDMCIIGNRGGEKQYEELIHSFEELLPSKHKKLFVLKNTQATWSKNTVSNIYQELTKISASNSRDLVLSSLQKYIP